MLTDRETAGQMALDERAAKLLQFPNRLNDIDLSGYRDEKFAHSVREATSYRDDLIRRVITRGEGDPLATHLPFNHLRGKFEFRQHELTIWTGYKGHGKSLMISQAMMAAIQRGKRVFIISPEFKPDAVLERMLYQHAKTQQPMDMHIDEYMRFVTERLWLYDVQSSLKPADVVALCRYAADRIQPDHILIDSLMKCGIANDDFNGQKQFVDHIQTVAHACPLHIHLVAHAKKGRDDYSPPKLHDIKGASEIADMAENVLVVWRNKNKEKDPEGKHDEPDASLTVEAQRNADGWIGSTNLHHDPYSTIFFEPGYEPEKPNYVPF